MARKKKGVDMETATVPINMPNAGNENIDLNCLKLAGDLFGQIPNDRKKEIEAMLFLISRGITPQEYEQVYQRGHSEVANAAVEDDSADDDWDMPPFATQRFDRIQRFVKEYRPLENASEHTLTLKVQMKGVTKPPMWREVEIPADYTFMELHMVIQTVVGLENCHLWQFNASAYDDGLTIGLPSKNSYDMGLDHVTHDAEKTPVTRFLQQKGDKLEYVYDFGDDWIFTVEVKSLNIKNIDHPVCNKFKGELNAIEDFGGVWAYLSAREDMDKWYSLTKKEQRQRADELGFDTPNEYIDFLNWYRFDRNAVNDRLMRQ